MDLRGKTILVTRAARQAEEFVRLLKDHGACPLVLPTIDIVPPLSWEEADEAIRAASKYTGLVFASVNGVEFFLARALECRGTLDAFRSMAIFAVGEKTARAVGNHGLTVKSIPERFTAHDLAALLRDDGMKGMNFLVPRGDLGGNALVAQLRNSGASVHAVTVYRTVRPPEMETDRIRSSILGGEIDVLTFTSPSTARNLFSLFTSTELSPVLPGITIAAIGPATADAIRALGYRVDVLAAESTVEGLVRSLVEASLPGR